MNTEGILPVNKERGYPSFHLVTLLRKRSGVRTIGHAGSLDPCATGVIVLLIGRDYTKRASQFMETEKEYLATVQLGVSTNTFDCDGKVTFRSTYCPSQSEVETAVAEFQGTIMQVPPMFSAKKYQGQTLYRLARQGVEVERKASPITLQTFLLRYSYPFIWLRIVCSKGTYVRSVAHDLGEKLTTGAHLTQLSRTRVGHLTLEDCVHARLLSDDHFSYSDYLIRRLR